MKTILYQPLFINPLAYFVFPLLYHIEKGDSYIEPANITGLLIINNLSEGLTLTPAVNVILDSNLIDFSLFKGKHIRISQYTNIGAVVLGEWYIPGAPEPEQPDENDILKSLVVHYNIGKQGANSIKTTSSLTDYSGNNRNATCKNFDWNNTEFVDDGKAMRFDGKNVI